MQPGRRATGLILLFSFCMLAACVLTIYLLQHSGNRALQVVLYVAGMALSGLVALRSIFAAQKMTAHAGELQRLQKELGAKNRVLSETNTRLQALATTDPLTGLANHRALVAALEHELARAHRYRHECSILFLDIDHFKALNDTYGHAVGDSVLSDFAALLQQQIRETDVPGRWGGEEFLVILPETGEQEARLISERARSAVAAHAFTMGGGMSLTCSIGIATFPGDASERDGLVICADQAMYAAKKLGRNQVRSASDPVTLALSKSNAEQESREDAALSGIVEALNALVEAHDYYTGQHTRRVAALATRLALALGLDATEARMIGLAGRLHDIGKVGISGAVLQKPERLNEQEHASMQEHTIVGAEIISRIPSLRALVPVIRTHHERWDGAGYPDGLAGTAIPLGARIVAVADAYDAIITERHYQPARDAASALNELRRCAGTQFDPDIVRALEEVLMQQDGNLASNTRVA
jgi:diguanylate cyclase (GGDEF)-like protein/putative nucleotidyltransferase with HDIG domain